jgi:hypothetical protein
MCGGGFCIGRVNQLLCGTSGEDVRIKYEKYC